MSYGSVVYFVYRSHYEGPLSKLVRRLPDETALAWFRRGWGCEDPRRWVEDELGVDVYGLNSIFQKARDLNLPRPESDEQLRILLHEHLYVEGGSDYIRLGEHGLRVRTDDDEVELAYFFLHDDIVRTAPDRLAYLVHEDWPLPDRAGPPRPFTPDVSTTLSGLSGDDDATTYGVFLTFYDGESLACSQPTAFPGVALPALARHLRTADAGEEWAPELRVLRALIAPDEDTLGPTLDRCNRWPGFNLNAGPWADLPDEHVAAHRRAVEIIEAGEYTDHRRPQDSLLQVGDHLAQLAMHCGDSFGYQQWYLFDTTWAATQPDLARSLLRYANHWDPLDE